MTRALPALFDLTGRVALVSGAASGMGRAMAIALAEAGADLMLAGRTMTGLEKTAGAPPVPQGRRGRAGPTSAASAWRRPGG